MGLNIAQMQDAVERACDDATYRMSSGDYYAAQRMLDAARRQLDDLIRAERELDREETA